MRASGDKLGLCDGHQGLNGGCMRASSSGGKLGLCDVQWGLNRDLCEVVRAIWGKLGLCEG